MKLLIIVLTLFSLVSCQVLAPKPVWVPKVGKPVISKWEILELTDCSDDMENYFECQSMYSNGDSGPSGDGDGDGE